MVGGIIAWFVALEKRLNSRMTRHEHAQICEAHNRTLEKKLDDIVTELKKQNEATAQHRQWVGENLGTIRTQVAIVRDRMGDNPFNDESSLRRREG